MKFNPVFVLSGLAILPLAAAVVMTSRAVSPILIQQEKQILVGVLPLVENLLFSRTGAGEVGVLKIGKLGGVDITILNDSGLIEDTTITGGAVRGGRLAAGEGEDTIFELAVINDISSFVLSSPIKLNGQDKRLVISQPDELLGPFFDELLTSAVFAALLGMVFAIGYGAYLKSYYAVSTATIQNVVSAKAAEHIKEVSASAEELMRSRLSLGEDERRAMVAALGSVSDGVLVIDVLGRITEFNSKMETLTGFGRDFVKQKVLSDILALTRTGKIDQLTGLIPRILSTGTAEVFPEDTLLKRNDGMFIPVSVKTIPVRDEARKNTTHVVVVISERKEKIPEVIKEAPKIAESPKILTVPTGIPKLRSTPPAVSVPAKVFTPFPSASPKISPEVHKDTEQLPALPPHDLPMKVALASTAPILPAEEKLKTELEEFGKELKQEIAVENPPPSGESKPKDEPKSIERVLAENEEGTLRKMQKNAAPLSPVAPVAPPPNLPI